MGTDGCTLVGKGYAPGQVVWTVALLRAEPKLFALFAERYV